MKILAILTVRNEGAFLLEWLAHHRTVGITDFIVCSNACTDGTDIMLDRLAEMGWLTHLRNPGPYGSRGVQFTALDLAGKHAKTAEADWILSIDIDEFVNVHTGDHTLSSLIAALPMATAITLTWRLFGNAGKIGFEDTRVLQSFTRCAPQIIHWPWRAAMFKTLYRNDGTYRRPGVHRPKSPDPTKLKNAKWFDGEGRALEESIKTGRVYSTYGRSNFALAQLNHYPLGAMESFVLKADRGRAVHEDTLLGMDYWVERNFNTDVDTSIQATAPCTQATFEALMADACLGEFHAAAVAWRHARFEELMRQDFYRTLFSRLLMASPSQNVTPQMARCLTEFALGKPIKNSKS
ncbi:glycosyltransferase family 2 protein [Roseobacter sp.]|uniref:glycosyltransferase family 2 protein n=1 Tax=Roseobacter sp. TaxID=1907202 RepID=UPI00385D638E